MAKVDMRRLKAELAQKGYKIFRKRIEPRIRAALQRETEKLLNAFDNHPVTKEIEGGPQARNSSGVLGGYGNLFTFIGFSDGSDPLSPLKSLLAKSIRIRSIRKKRNVLALSVTFSTPSQEEIARVTPSPWSSDSWAEALERGMTGLGRYLYSSQMGRFSSSRSGRAIEATLEVRGASSSSPIEYMSEILADMLDNLERSLKRL